MALIEWLRRQDAATRAAWTEWFSQHDNEPGEDDFVRFHDLNEDGTE